MSIPFISSSILEACSQILLQTSFARLCSLPVCSRKTGSPPHYSCSSLYLFPFQCISPDQGSVVLELVFLPVFLLCSWNTASFCWKSLSGDHICLFMVMLHLNVLSARGWLKLSICSHLLISFRDSHLSCHEWGWGSVLEVSLLLSHSLVYWGICHLPFYPLQRALLALLMCVCAPLVVILFHDVHGTSLECLVRWLCSGGGDTWRLRFSASPRDLLHLWVSVSKW